MNKEQFEGKWKELKGQVKEAFSKLTDDDITMIKGKREQLVGALQKRYGIAKEKAEENLRNFETHCGCEEEEAMGKGVKKHKKTGTYG